MLLYSTRTAVLKNNEGKSVLLCKITLPTGADEAEVDERISGFYKSIYDTTYAAAKEYALRISGTASSLAIFSVMCEDLVKNDKLILRRTYTLSDSASPSKVRTFKDKFNIKCDKTKNYSIKERK